MDGDLFMDDQEPGHFNWISDFSTDFGHESILVLGVGLVFMPLIALETGLRAAKAAGYAVIEYVAPKLPLGPS